jgi:hypothetical protein
MNYSTLQEAYNIDSFEKKRKKKSVNEEVVLEQKEEPKTDVIIDRQDRTMQTEEPKDELNAFKSKSKLQPYYDEELDQYLSYKQFNEGPLNEKPKYETSREQIIRSSAVPKIPPDMPVPHNQPKAVPEQQNTRQSMPIHYEPYVQYTPNISEKKDLFYKNLVNIGLFIFIGVLIIFLCDQITEIAISIGMKRTVALLEPYLQNRI